MTANLYRCTPRQTREYVTDCLEAGLVPFVQSSPGMGKSSIIHQIAKTFNLKVIDLRLSTCAPEDMSGLPEFYDDEFGQRRARFVSFDMFPLEFNKLPEGYDGWMIFYDEANSATKMVQAASYKVILDRLIGQSKLHDRVVQVAAGNLMTDRAIVERLSTAMQSRLVHIEMELSHPQWLEDVAFAQHYDPRIIAYLSYKESELMDFRPDHDEKTFCCPRTWEFMNKLVKGKPLEVIQTKTALYAGTITSGSATNFVAFCQLQADLISVKDILAEPTGAAIPQEAQRKWIVTTHLLEKLNDKNFSDICSYINRFDLAFRLVFFRGVIAQHPTLRSHPEFTKAMIVLSKYLNK